jgi:hypothetical protein
VQQFKAVSEVPAEIIARTDAVSGSSEQIFKLIDVVKVAKSQRYVAQAIKDKWTGIIAGEKDQ